MSAPQRPVPGTPFRPEIPETRPGGYDAVRRSSRRVGLVLLVAVVAAGIGAAVWWFGQPTAMRDVEEFYEDEGLGCGGGGTTNRTKLNTEVLAGAPRSTIESIAAIVDEYGETTALGYEFCGIGDADEPFARQPRVALFVTHYTSRSTAVIAAAVSTLNPDRSELEDLGVPIVEFDPNEAPDDEPIGAVSGSTLLDVARAAKGAPTESCTTVRTTIETAILAFSLDHIGPPMALEELVGRYLRPGAIDVTAWAYDRTTMTVEPIVGRGYDEEAAATC